MPEPSVSPARDVPPAARSPLLYSQVAHDERGNFKYQGDLQRVGRELPELTTAIQQHLERAIVGSRFSLRGERFSGGRKVIAEIIDTCEDLSVEEIRRAFDVRVIDQMERFGFVRSNVLQDYTNVSFYTEVRVGGAYWAALAARKGTANPVKATLSLAAFKRAIKVGDQLKLTAAPAWHRSIGITRTIVAVRSADLVLAGPSYLTLPKAAAFACDGERVRIGVYAGHAARALRPPKR